jgi:hypothetical protein
MLQTILNFISSVWFAIAATFGINTGTEQPRYDAVEQVRDDIEIRRYPPRIVAETTVDVSKSDNPRGDAFRIVAGYIFGANKSREKLDMTSPVEISSKGTTIAMTAPVEVKASDRVLVMRFFMPAKYKIDQLPEPTDSRVKLIEVPSTTVAVMQFSGSTDDDSVTAKTAELTRTLESTKWKATGPSTAFFYNPPWTIPFLRTNEVAIPVTKLSS